MSEYLFDRASERRRLDALSALHDPDTFRRLEGLGVRAGWKCLEIGAGSGSVARWLAERGASVVATDLDLRGLETELPPLGIEVRQHDIANDQVEEAAFDLVHARAVLQHVPGRAAALARMVGALRPGGILLVEDVVMPHAAAHPELPAWSKVIRGIEVQLRGAGANPHYGLELDAALRSHGLADVRCTAHAIIMYSGTPSMDVNILSLEQLRDRLVAAGIVTAEEVATVLSAFRTPGTTVASAIMVAASGVRDA